MDTLRLQELLKQGENQRLEFKSEQINAAGLAKEMVAFANTHGGIILLGVEDDGTVSGIQRTDLEEWAANIARNGLTPAIQIHTTLLDWEGKKICVLEVPKGSHKPYQTIEGRYLIRVGSNNRMATKEELSRLFQLSGLVHFDISPVVTANEKDLDNQKLHDYWQTYYQIDYLNLDDNERLQLLKNADILAETEDGDWKPTVGGLLIFAKSPQQRLPQAEILFAVFKGENIADELLDKKQVGGTIPEQIDRTAVLIKLFQSTKPTLEGNKRQENPDFPDEAIREALVNAVAHRDYSIINQRTTVYLFSDRLEITSPGGLPNTLTLEKIKIGNSAPRNLFLIKYLDNLRYIDGLGRGVPRMSRLLGNRFRLEEVGILFRLTFFR